MKSLKLKALVAAGVIISAVQPAEARHYPHYAPPAHVNHVSYISPPFFSISYGSYSYHRPHYYHNHRRWAPPRHHHKHGHRDRSGARGYVHHKR